MSEAVALREKLSEVEKRYEEVERTLGRPEVASDAKEYAKLAKEHAALEEVVTCFREWRKVHAELEDSKDLLEDSDPEVRDLAQEEIAGLSQRATQLEDQLHLLLLPSDPLDEKNVILEIRAGTGGEEASLFAADLFRMYSHYAEQRHWRMEVLSSSPTGLGGFKEIISMITGKKAYSRLKFEGGVHRVQRVPETEASGRIHTSAVTVAVLPEADEVDIAIDEKNSVSMFFGLPVRADKVSIPRIRPSALRDLPTNLVVSCQDEKSQHKNKTKALKSCVPDSSNGHKKNNTLKSRLPDAAWSARGIGPSGYALIISPIAHDRPSDQYDAPHAGTYSRWRTRPGRRCSRHFASSRNASHRSRLNPVLRVCSPVKNIQTLPTRSQYPHVSSQIP